MSEDLLHGLYCARIVTVAVSVDCLRIKAAWSKVADRRLIPLNWKIKIIIVIINSIIIIITIINQSS